MANIRLTDGKGRRIKIQLPSTRVESLGLKTMFILQPKLNEIGKERTQRISLNKRQQTAEFTNLVDGVKKAVLYGLAAYDNIKIDDDWQITTTKRGCAVKLVFRQGKKWWVVEVKEATELAAVTAAVLAGLLWPDGKLENEKGEAVGPVA